MVKNITLLVPWQLCSLFWLTIRSPFLLTIRSPFLLTIRSLFLLTICSLCLFRRYFLLATNRIYVLVHGLLCVLAPHIITYGINACMHKVSIILCIQPVIYNTPLLICEYYSISLRSSLSLTQRLNI